MPLLMPSLGFLDSWLALAFCSEILECDEDQATEYLSIEPEAAVRVEWLDGAPPGMDCYTCFSDLTLKNEPSSYRITFCFFELRKQGTWHHPS